MGLTFIIFCAYNLVKVPSWDSSEYSTCSIVEASVAVYSSQKMNPRKEEDLFFWTSYSPFVYAKTSYIYQYKMLLTVCFREDNFLPILVHDFLVKYE